MTMLKLVEGSSTSGNYGHAGVPGSVGGSAPGGGSGKPGIGKITVLAPGDSKVSAADIVFADGRTQAAIYIDAPASVIDQHTQDTFTDRIQKNIENLPGEGTHITELMLGGTIAGNEGLHGGTQAIGHEAGPSAMAFNVDKIDPYLETCQKWPGQLERMKANGIVKGSPLAKYLIPDNVNITSTTRDEVIQGVVDHEMGHALYNSLGPETKARYAQIYASSKAAFSKVSRYAAQDRDEAFAENYAAHMNGIKIPFKVSNFLSGILGKAGKLK